MIDLQNVYAGYGGATKGSAGDIIKGITFHAQRGECLCILGPNGCGKSTLLKAIARIIDFRGKVLLDSENITALPRKKLAKKIALLSQSTTAMFPYTVYETVALGRYAHSEGFFGSLSANDKAIIADVMQKLDICDIKDRMINELSGGQMQRVFLAKNLAQNPDVILLDEPANHLDLKNQIELLRYLKSWVRENNKIFIGVFHDLNLVHHFGDTALLMENGTTAVWGEAGQVLNSPQIKSVYGIDIRAFMLESLANWQ